METSQDNPEVTKEDELFCAYVSGFVDGEGCFSVSFAMRDRIKVGFEVRPSFSIGQNQSTINYALLLRIRNLFEGGGIRGDKNRKGFYKYETRALAHLQEKIIPFFSKYPLRTQKSQDFKHFCDICSLMEAKRHLDPQGLLVILGIAEKMNVSGTRRIDISGIRKHLHKL